MISHQKSPSRLVFTETGMEFLTKTKQEILKKQREMIRKRNKIRIDLVGSPQKSTRSILTKTIKRNRTITPRELKNRRGEGHPDHSMKSLFRPKKSTKRKFKLKKKHSRVLSSSSTLRKSKLLQEIQFSAPRRSKFRSPANVTAVSSKFETKKTFSDHDDKNSLFENEQDESLDLKEGREKSSLAMSQKLKSRAIFQKEIVTSSFAKRPIGRKNKLMMSIAKKSLPIIKRIEDEQRIRQMNRKNPRLFHRNDNRTRLNYLKSQSEEKFKKAIKKAKEVYQKNKSKKYIDFDRKKIMKSLADCHSIFDKYKEEKIRKSISSRKRVEQYHDYFYNRKAEILKRKMKLKRENLFSLNSMMEEGFGSVLLSDRREKTVI